jgi:hypothetical protein
VLVARLFIECFTRSTPYFDGPFHESRMSNRFGSSLLNVSFQKKCCASSLYSIRELKNLGVAAPNIFVLTTVNNTKSENRLVQTIMLSLN